MNKFEYDHTLLNSIYKTSTEEEVEAWIDLIDDMLLDGQFARVNHWLATVDIDRIGITQILDILVWTKAAKDKLPNRAYFYSVVYNKYSKLTPLIVDKLFTGLK